MSDRHLKVLLHRHGAIDAKIAELRRRPGTWPPSIVRLKRMRLAVKDQIARYRRAPDPTGAC